MSEGTGKEMCEAPRSEQWQDGGCALCELKKYDAQQEARKKPGLAMR